MLVQLDPEEVEGFDVRSLNTSRARNRKHSLFSLSLSHPKSV